VSEENIRRSPNLQSDMDFRVIIGSDFDPSGPQSIMSKETPEAEDANQPSE